MNHKIQIHIARSQNHAFDINKSVFTYPLLNFLNGGRITALLLITQCLPILTFAKSPLMTQSVIIIV